MRLLDALPRFRLLRRLMLALLFVLAVSFMSGCYLSHVAVGQIKLSCSSVSVEEALRMGCLSDEDKAKLRYVQDVRRFAEETVHLKKSDNFSTYYPGSHEPLNWIVTAAPKNILAPVTWWFPVVGTMSYKGFFGREAADDEARSLSEKGYDVSVRPAGAYSTVGWFTDPIMPLMLDMDEGALANIVIHELTHGTVFSSGHTTYNESLAEFVGREGGRQFLEETFGRESEQVKAYRSRQEDKRSYDVFMRSAALRLEALYATKPNDLAAARAKFFWEMRRDFVAMRSSFKTEAYRQHTLGELNNAVMVGHLAYANTVPFERAYAAFGRDWKKFIDLAQECAESEHPHRCLAGNAKN